MNKPDPNPVALEDLTFEDAQAQLEAVVRELEGGQVPLDRSLALFERGIALREVCRARLAAFEGRLEKLVQDSSGELRIEAAE